MEIFAHQFGCLANGLAPPNPTKGEPMPITDTRKHRKLPRSEVGGVVLPANTFGFIELAPLRVTNT